MNDSQKYVALMTALGKVSKSMDINLKFSGDNFEEMLFKLVLDCRQQVNDSWLHMFGEVTGDKPEGVQAAAEYLRLNTKATKK
tara:strand:+ start:597 stop:845 length:249 start_codon:yes stop_codon:yes gene_type:complete